MVSTQTESRFRIVQEPKPELGFRLSHNERRIRARARRKTTMMTTAHEYERRRWIALALLCFAQFIVVLDASIVNVALPSIGEGLDFSQENLAWAVNAYVLTFGGFL